MCGIAGYVDLRGEGRVVPSVVTAMTETLVHRGPDSSGYFCAPDIGLGVRRLKILDLQTGDQPIYNEDRSIVLVCNGEIFNYRELRARLTERGHRFRSQTDVEVLVHLYEEHGAEAVSHLNGQFAFALHDSRRGQLLLARDHFGINPLHYAIFDGFFLFASESKAILAHPAVVRQIDLVGLDQILSLPGLVSPRTIFKGIESLPSGHLLRVAGGAASTRKYWDLEYPLQGEEPPEPDERECTDRLRELFYRSVEMRLQADVPVGLFVSGGMDSSLVAAVASCFTNAPRHSFSIAFADEEIDESKYQKLVARALGTEHHEICIDDQAIASRMEAMVFHCECPVKESFNTCALALAEEARVSGVKVVLGGEGADEIFGGYPGYRFDALGPRRENGLTGVDAILEEELRERLWGDRNLFYEREYVAFRELKTVLYSPTVVEAIDDVDCLNYPLVDKKQLAGRHPLHQRSYLDFKLRLADHLLSEHGDRMVMAHSVEARYPFLDIDLVEFATCIPPSLKVNGYIEKYIVRRMAEGVIPPQILKREKLGFRAPGTPLLLQRGSAWASDLLSYDRIRRQGYFSPEIIERLKRQYSQPGFRLHPHLEVDILMIVLTFSLLCDRFGLPSLN